MSKVLSWLYWECIECASYWRADSDSHTYCCPICGSLDIDMLKRPHYKSHIHQKFLNLITNEFQVLMADQHN